MQRQLTLWLAKGPPAAAQRIWEALDESERTRLAVALARLISQVVRPENVDQGTEDNHER